MPKIEPYQSRVESTGAIAAPRANAETFGSQMGVGLEKLGAGLTAGAEHVQKAQEQSEVSDISAKIAKAHADFTIKSQEALKSGNVDVQDLQKELDDHLEDLRSNLTTRVGQNHFDSSAAQLQAHFLETNSAGAAHLAGVKQVKDFTGAQASRESALMNDPSSHSLVQSQMEQDLNARVATGLPAEAAEKLRLDARESIAKAAVRGWLKLDPDSTMKDLNSGKWDQYLNGDQKHQMLGETKMEINARRIEENRLQSEQERVKAEAADKSKTTMLNAAVEGTLSWDTIYADKNLSFADKNQMLNIMDKHNSEKIKTDPATFNSLFQRIHADESDPKKIRSQDDLIPYFNRGLDLPALNQLRGEFEGKHTEAGKIESQLKAQLMKVAEQKLTKSNPMLGIKDAAGEENLLKWQNDFLQTYADGKKKGLTPQQLLNPASKDYVGNSISNFVKTPKQMMQENVKYLRATPTPTGTPVPTGTPPPARKAGEDAAVYLQRTGK